MDGCVGIAPSPRATQNKHAESENSGQKRGIPAMTKQLKNAAKINQLIK